MSKFEALALDARIIKGLEQAGYVEPFPIQEKAIGPLLQGKDVIGQAKTGTGKTAAYGLPILQRIDLDFQDIQGLVLSPTRELAVQITQELRKLGRYTGTKIATIYGGQSVNIQLEALNHGVHLVVGTPGRIIDLMQRRALILDFVKYVVIDEADKMLEMGFIEDVEYILNAVPMRKQLSLFSATMPEEIIRLSRKYMKEPEKILIDSDEPSVETLEQYFTWAEEEDKLTTLLEILSRERPVQTIVFCATKYRAHRLAQELERRYHRVVPLHGDLSQHQRDSSMHRFRAQQVDVLVATDLAGRGIDIPQVACVVNYDAPKDPLTYFHRVGRTARAGGSGKAFTLVSQMDHPDFVRIQQMTSVEIKPLRPQDRDPDYYQLYYRRSLEQPYSRPNRPQYAPPPRQGGRRPHHPVNRPNNFKWKRFR